MPIQLLLVLDGIYRFGEPAASADFTFITLVDALTAAGVDVTKAHRNTTGDGDINGFDFSTHDLLQYDVLWLVGFDGRNEHPPTTSPSGANKLSAAELGAIASYMDAGGGVFATGDHDSIGADMCGHIPRVRTMRAWFGELDGASPMPSDFPRNYHREGLGRADTVRPNPLGDGNIYFENQSDSVPQPIVPTTSPAHPILRRGGHDILVFPDHMHEGKPLGRTELAEDHYTVALPSGVGGGFEEFPFREDGVRQTPEIIAHGDVLAHELRILGGGSFGNVDPKTTNILSVYDGRAVGVGRVVIGATFHHYIDINLTGASNVNTAAEKAAVGDDAEKGQGFNWPSAASTFADIKAAFVNIAHWLARPEPKIEIILERSTFSQDEVGANPIFEGAVLVTVDGLKPSQFPAGGIDDLLASPTRVADWAPSFPAPASGVVIEPRTVSSDAPSLPDRIQRFTFTYRVRFDNESAFTAIAGDSQNFPVTATLGATGVAAPLTDTAVIQLLTVANPFMLDLDHPDAKTWLSSDVRVFRVREGQTYLGHTLPMGASKEQAYAYIRSVLNDVTVTQFDNLPVAQPSSTLSSMPMTSTGQRVYNFALARVRVDGAGATANGVRVFFRIFTTQTTAALTYVDPAGGNPQQGYKRTSGANPIAIPGTNAAGDEWLSFPFFAQTRSADPQLQSDPENVQAISPSVGQEFFGALIDNNLPDPYLPLTPGGAGNVGLTTHLMGEHQCLVAEIQYAGAPIPNGARPSTSDKLAQRNLAVSVVANPGLDASRMALHTFEIEATPRPITDELGPDELLLEWTRDVPDGTYTSIYIPTWNAHEVIELADRLYPHHDLRAEDDHTVTLPARGTRYVPIPRSMSRQCGVLIADLPLGIRKGQRFDLAVRQITNRGHVVKAPPSVATHISKAEAKKILAGLDKRKDKAATHRTTFDLGDNRTLFTDVSAFDLAGDGAVIVQAPDPKQVEEARRKSIVWRETVGGFQLGVPVSVKGDMVEHHARLLSVLRWRAEFVRRDSRWYTPFRYYVELIAKKVAALGIDPHSIPTTPDGQFDLPGRGDAPGRPGGGHGGLPGGADPGHGTFEPGDDDWLDETTGLPDPHRVRPAMISGKVSGLLFDHFGDFEGFTLEVYSGHNVRFFSREPAIREIVEQAWRQRPVVTVVTVAAKSHRVRRVLVRGYPHT
jgi:hypothetical protein